MSPDTLLERPTYLFGAGGAASWILQGFRREGIEIAGFVDDAADRIGSVASLPVVSPDDPTVDEGRRRDSVVVFAVMSPAVDEAAVKERLLDLGWGTVRGFGEYGRMVLEESGKRCSMLDASDLAAHSVELEKSRLLLGDDQSRQIFDAFLDFVRDLDDTGFPPVSPHPYFPDDVPRWADPLRLIDLGAYDGDTMRYALKRGYAIEATASFEPDPNNYAKLAATAAEVPGATAWPLGVLDSTCTLRFSAQGDAGSYVSEDGEILVQCVALDQAIPHFAPNLIKLDIEGSEEQALRGAEQLIRKYRPGLAVSLYHLSTDLWRIPLYLSEVLGPDTTFLLRRHSRTIADTVLYVQPAH